MVMPKKRFSAEQIVTLLRQVEVAMGQGKSTQIACRDAGISEQSFYHWRKEYGGLQVEQARRLKDLEKENKSSAAADISFSLPGPCALFNC
jgi:putative transposase